MIININNEKEILGYAMTGELGEGIQFDGLIPDEFYENFKPRFYLLQNNEIIVNPNYVPPKPPVDGPGSLDKALAQLTLQTAQHKADQDRFNAQLLLQIAQMKENK